jgi:hypothetical protein
VGTHLGWQIPSGADNNFTTWDLGIGYRPLPWLGSRASRRTSAGRRTRCSTATAAASRFGRPATSSCSASTTRSQRRGRSTPRTASSSRDAPIEPTSGLVIRGYANQEGEVGGGLEFYFGGTGVGAHARASTEDSGDGNIIGYLQSAPLDRTLIRTGKKVPEIDIAQAFPYQPSSGIFGTRGESYLHLLIGSNEPRRTPP